MDIRAFNGNVHAMNSFDVLVCVALAILFTPIVGIAVFVLLGVSSAIIRRY
jgi:hypothetical protein